MKIYLDRNDIEEAIVKHVKEKFGFTNNDEFKITQGKSASAVVVIQQDTKGDNSEEYDG